MMYNFDIIYRPGRVISNADAESRIHYLPQSLTINSMPNADKINFAEDQHSDPVLKDIITHLRNNNNDKKTQNYSQSFLLDAHNLLWKKLQKVPPNDQPLRLVVPTSNKFDVMQRFYNDIFGGHRGVKTTYEKIKERYYWVNVYKEI